MYVYNLNDIAVEYKHKWRKNKLEIGLRSIAADEEDF
jgi:hypothetical protein